MSGIGDGGDLGTLHMDYIFFCLLIFERERAQAERGREREGDRI